MIFRRFLSCTGSTAGNLAKESAAVLWMTIDTEEKAIELAQKIVNAELAACVNIMPKVKSIYRWRGSVQTDEEHILMIKTQPLIAQNKLLEFVKNNHPYEIPEYVFTEVRGSDKYIEWIFENTKL